MHQILPILALALVAAESGASAAGALELRRGELGGLVLSSWNLDQETSADPLRALELEVVERLGPGVSLVEVARRDSLTVTSIWFEQRIDGRRVVGGDGVIRVSREGRLRGAAGVFAARPETSMATAGWTRRPVGVPPGAARIWLNRQGVAVPAFAFEEGEGMERALVIVAIDGERRVEDLAYNKKATVFEANPVTVLNDPTLRDQDDSASAVPAAAYTEVDLDLDDEDQLANRRVRVTSLEDPVTARADPSGSLDFDRSMPQFEEVMVFHHIDTSLEYVEALGFTGGSQAVERTILVDAHASAGADNSYYSKQASGDPTLRFGDGGVDDAEDPDIILHELGHVLHDGLSPSALSGGSATEGRALSEGFSDYWAFSQGWAASVESGRDPYCIGDWDARCGGGSSERCSYPAGADCLRRIDSANTMDDFLSSGGSGTEHRNGMIWSSTLKEIFLGFQYRVGGATGRELADRTILEGLTGLPFRASFEDAARRLIEVDDDLNGSWGRDVICGAFYPRGIRVEPCVAGLDGRYLHLVSGSGPLVLAAGRTWTGSEIVERQGAVDGVRLLLRLDQPAGSSFAARLIAPSGESVRLTPANGWLGPLDGTFGLNIPSAEPLSVLHGTDAAGEWRLEIEPGESGVTVLSWNLILSLEGHEPVSRSGAGAITALIPAVASTAGAQGTRFVTDLTLFNRTNFPQVAYLLFTPAENPAETLTVSMEIGPEETVTVPDIVRTLFDTAGVGGLEVRGARDWISVSSRTYNAAGAGTFGQAIGPYSTAVAVLDRSIWVHGLREGEAYRTNVGMFEISGSPAQVEVRLRGSDGQTLGVQSVSLAGHQQLQIPIGPLAGIEGFRSGSVELKVTGGSGVIAGYGSVVDNRSGDSIYIAADLPPVAGSSSTIPVAAHLDGGSGTRWRTDLMLFNPTSENLSFELIYRSFAGSTLVISEMSIGPYASELIEDVLLTRFGVTDGAGQVRVESELLIASRTWNEGTAGTYGQFIGARSVRETIDASRRTGYAVGVVEGKAYRTNAGITEITGGFAAYRLSILDEQGNVRCTQTIGLAPWQGIQTNIRSMGCGTIGAGTLRMEYLSGEGRAVGYISVVDNVTGDPTYVPVSGGGVGL